MATIAAVTNLLCRAFDTGTRVACALHSQRHVMLMCPQHNGTNVVRSTRFGD